MAPAYKLIYFNARGKAEHIRFIFAYAGVDYVDERIPKEKWSHYKSRMPYGMVPVLEINGKQVAQSNAIARYLARQYGLAGKDEWESLQCDVLVDTLSDLKQALFQYRMEPDPLRKDERKQTLLKETIPFFLDKFEKVLEENGGFSVGGALTWTDFVFAVSLENFELIFGKESLDHYPKLKALKDKVFSLPRIQEWIKKRPVTEF
ncbi:glutathione S-transferase-like [Schistocerca americana]|uniref:glutathione S-transferase-like n=1 Tax=Schistocerca americana TaxID=7009 RepID=UPI001F5017FA|nr:glutathione S-transferase-like [Schistocerca americana]XP_047107860.1 glutathione S-transferase-like [Schistocerca piceifrons]XP_049773472.1 glutathione S-transferase-like [Schistocerca cancellata]XP_049799421.1 glutathione S-transferase-like [Schistocerca nitens]XP_049856612.1 glutathione S-transferase-like [Schistocerca gregaria]XP_049856613.1 glutathione S-transferase-like [Schistocerca gregaria]XP_049948948.1 glutathione S-transferase-like [Schistocerca serialis cubense]